MPTFQELVDSGHVHFNMTDDQAEDLLKKGNLNFVIYTNNKAKDADDDAKPKKREKWIKVMPKNDAPNNGLMPTFNGPVSDDVLAHPIPLVNPEEEINYCFYGYPMDEKQSIPEYLAFIDESIKYALRDKYTLKRTNQDMSGSKIEEAPLKRTRLTPESDQKEEKRSQIVLAEDAAHPMSDILSVSELSMNNQFDFGDNFDSFNWASVDPFTENFLGNISPNPINQALEQEQRLHPSPLTINDPFQFFLDQTRLDQTSNSLIFQRLNISSQSISPEHDSPSTVQSLPALLVPLQLDNASEKISKRKNTLPPAVLFSLYPESRAAYDLEEEQETEWLNEIFSAPKN